MVFSNIKYMEHQGEYVIFVAISAIIEANMKKKIDEEEEEEINRLYPNRDRYNNDEYEIENNDGDDDGDDDDDDNLDVDRHKSSQPDLSEGKTVIFRIVLRYNNLIQKPDIIPQYNCYNVAGIVMFVKEEHNNPYVQHDEQSEHNYLTEMLTTNCTIINAEGIYRINYSISNSFYNQYKDNVHTIDMYNLSTMEQEQIFIIRHNEKVFHTAKNVSSVFAVSRNKQLIACSNGEGTVTLFWTENGLDIGVKEFGIETKILFLEFIENDERLLIITEETCTKEELKIINGDKPDMFGNNLDYKQKKVQYDVNYDKLSTVMEEERKNPDDKKKQIDQVEEREEKYVNNDNLLKQKMPRRRSTYKDESIVTKIKVWDLFSSADNAIRTGMTGDLFPSKENYHSHIARVPGILYHMREDGYVFSIMEHDGFMNLVKGKERDLTRDFGCDIFYDSKNKKDQKDRMPCVYAINDEPDVKLHKVYNRRETKKSVLYKVIANNREPWIYMNNYNRTSVFLDEEETVQLIIGHSTVQIWRKLRKQKESDKKGVIPQNKEAVLEYIWANNIPSEYDIEGARLQIRDLWVGDNSFVLKVCWEYDEGSKLINNTETLSFPYADGHVTPVLHACKALEHLNDRKNDIIDYKKMVEFEQLIENTNRIVWRFVKKKPEVFKMTFEELKHEKKLKKNMKEFYDDKQYKYKQILHIPKAKQWISAAGPQRRDEVKLESKSFLHQIFSFISEIILWFFALISCKKKKKKKKKKEKIKKKSKRSMVPCTDLEWAIEYCNDKERKDAVMVGYLLEYYSENALHHIGWMTTISKALPLLYRYNLDYYVKPLFYKDCFADKELTQYDPSEIIPEHSKPRRNKTQDFKAFKPNTKLVSDKNHKPVLQNIFEFITFKVPKYFTDFIDNFDNDRAPPPVALRVVPLPNFTVDNIPKKPSLVMSIFVASSFQLSDGFGAVQNSTEIIVCISFTMLLLWCEMLLYLRLLSEMAIYIYYIIIIFSTVFPFLVFMCCVIMAFAHAFFLLLSNPDTNIIIPKSDSFNIINTTTQEQMDIEMDAQFDPSSYSDNPFSNFITSVEATTGKCLYSYYIAKYVNCFYGWWTEKVMFYSGVYEEAAEKGRDALLRYRATLISDYEALEDIRFWSPEPDPQFIFYVGHSQSVEEWTEDRKQFKGCIYQRYENRASYKRYKFQEEPSDKYSLLKYEIDKKDNNSSISFISNDGKIVSGSSLPLDETFKDFQRTVNDKLAEIDQNITQISDIQNTINGMQELFTVFIKKLALKN
ncbi:hypothetical protein GLOIN_2v848825 [Rhizophagus clarus]|uniref:Uncharacterized protein n=1 Tax=Rhizophagus clarus TaxID=94130 RepID=A0A8H3LSR9_9GLOM|nr:hypothetical protein GLOIN_2v848825 [Rhizophagus clarus]